MGSSVAFKAVCLACLLVIMGLLFLDRSLQYNTAPMQTLPPPDPCQDWKPSTLQDEKGEWVWEMASLNQLFDYLEQPHSYCRAVHLVGGVPMEKLRKFYVEGNKAMCTDPPFKMDESDCVVYSFTVNSEQWSFEFGMAEKGCRVYVFDPEKYEDEVEAIHPNVKMYRYRIGVDDEYQMRGGKGIHEWRRMSTIVDELTILEKNFQVDYIKIAAGGDELNFLEDMTQKRSRTLNHFKQINMEINLGIYGMPSWGDAGKYYRHFVSLEKRGYRLFSSRINPIDHASYLLRNIDRVVHSHYDLVWGKCDKNFRQNIKPFNGTTNKLT